MDKEEFFSVHSLARKLKCQPSLIHSSLRERLNLVFKETKLFPHFLNSTQKIDRVEGSNQLFQLLEKSKRNGYRNIITGDQSLFQYHYPLSGAWLLEDEEASIDFNPQMSYEKLMITVIGEFMEYIF